jgi:WD40 repeat protein
MIMRIMATFGMLCLASVTLAQGKSKLEPIAPAKIDHPDPVAYEKEIEPIFANKCFACHSGKEINGKLDLSSYDKLMKGGKKGASLEPGKSAESLLFKLCGRLQKPAMPPVDEEPLTPTELALIKLWIDQGAKPPTGASGIGKAKVVLTLPSALVKPVRALAIRPDQSLIAAGRGNQIHLFKSTGEFLKTLIDPTLKTADGKPAAAAHISLVESMAFSPDGKTLATGSFQELKLWDVDQGSVKQTLGGFADRVTSIDYSPDSKYIATGGGAPTEEGEVRLFEAGSGKLVLDLKNTHSDSVFGVAFSPNSAMLATCGADKFVKVWEVPSGKAIKSFEGHTHHVLDVGWKPDGKVLVSGGADNVLKIWDFEKGEQIKTVANAHQKQITRLVFIGKTNTFLTSSGDQSAKLWNADGGNQRTFGGSTDFLYSVAATLNGELIATGGEEGIVRLYNGDNGNLIKALYPPGSEPKPLEKKGK